MARNNTIGLGQMYVADFETCDSDDLYRIDGEGRTIYNQRVWLAGLMCLATMEPVFFSSIDCFMKKLLERGDNLNREYAFHNLKFDGSFIVPWLLNNGFLSVQDRPQRGEFSCLIDDRNNWYSITIQVTCKRRVLLWDSLKLFPTALEYLHGTYGTPTQKVQEDESFYEHKRPVDHEPTERELLYMTNDLQVLAETLNAHIKYYGPRFRKTQAGQSFYDFEQHFKSWKLRFPPLTDDQDKAIRPGYWGGISHVSERYAGKDMFDIDVYDINSSYPYQLAFQKMPYGHATSFGPGVKPDMSKFWVAECVMSFKLKKDRIPCIPAKAITEGRPIDNGHWVTESDGLCRVVFSCLDYLTMLDSYDLNVCLWEWHMCWPWKVHTELTEYITMNDKNKTKYRHLADQEDDIDTKNEYLARSQRAKINKNAFYGKFGEDVIKYGKTPHLEEDGDVSYRVDRFDILTMYKRKFLPVAIATTAWGRQQLVYLANRLGKDFIYCDTDSIHMLRSGQSKIDVLVKSGDIILDHLLLGAWDKETEFDRGRFLRAKCYFEQQEGKDPEVTLAGLPADKHNGPRSKKRSVITWENFHIGLYIPPGKSNKLGSRRTKTGNKLISVGFEISERPSLSFY